MKKKLNRLFEIGLALSMMFGVGLSVNTQETKPVEASSSSYWADVNPKANANNLFNKLHTLVDIETPTGDKGYDELWDRYQITDKVPGKNKIWDMYGGFQFDYKDRAGNYSNEGDCYNREHSIPKSWWNTVKDERYCDIIHLVPTDGKVNGMRSNYAFGEVANATYSYRLEERTDGSGNKIQSVGYSKLGSGKAINGVTAPSIVFEPDDQYKGDFARIYYYFATRYGPKNKMPTLGQGATMFNTSFSDFYLTTYGKALLNKWHVQDPVSQKELDRNDGVETTVGNRNPYVDHPEWADKIFGSNYAATHGGGSETPSLYIAASSNSINVGETVTLTANINNLSGQVLWYIEDSSTNVITLSSTSGDSITVTGVGAGNKKVYAYVGDIFDWVSITVSSSGGGGNVNTENTGNIKFGTASGRLNINSTSVSGEDSLGNTWNINTVGTTSFTPNSNYCQIGSSSKPATSISFSTTFSEEKEIANFSVSLGGFNSTAGNVTLKVDDYTVASGNLNASNDVTIEANDISKIGNSLSITITNISKGVKAYEISYSFKSASTIEKELSSISLNTSETTKTFTVGDTFTYAGLIVTANYSNSTSAAVTPTSVSTPDMSTAGNKTVTVTYTEDGVTKTNTYSITVNALAVKPTFIEAWVGKEFYVGDEIKAADLTVQDNFGNEITNFTFENDGYKFKYSDGGSNGELTLKTFENAVTYDDLVCSLQVVVKRRERTTVSNVEIKDTLTADDFAATNTTYVDSTNVEGSSGAIYCANSAKDTSGNIQMRIKNSNSGIVSITSGGSVKSVKINVGSGSNKIEVYGKNTAYSKPADLYDNGTRGTFVGEINSTDTIIFSTPYKFVGIKSGSGAIYVESIEITYNVGESDTAMNVANFIMYSDEEGQCVTKFDSAEQYFKGLSIAERTKFMTDDDYVISNARERLCAWALNQGKTIVLEDGDYKIKKNSGALNNKGILSGIAENDSSIILIMIATIGTSVVSALHILKKKRLSK